MKSNDSDLFFSLKRLELFLQLLYQHEYENVKEIMSDVDTVLLWAFPEYLKRPKFH